MRPKSPRTSVHLPSLQLERNRLIRLRSNQQILKVLIGRDLNPLLESTHEPIPRLNLGADLRVLQLEEQSQLPSNRVPKLSNFVAGATDFQVLFWRDELLADHALWQAGYRVEVSAFFGFTGGTTGKVGLVFTALGVGEVGTIILVDC